MSQIIYSSLRTVKSSRNRVFAAGLYVQKPARLPVAPSDTDRQWAAENLNRTADPSADEVADHFERLTLSRDEFLELQYEAEMARLDRYADAYEAEVAEMGSQVGHMDAPGFTDAEEAQIRAIGLGRYLEADTPWTYSDAQLDRFEAEMAAKKAARKPRPRTLRQINRAARKAATA